MERNDVREIRALLIAILVVLFIYALEIDRLQKELNELKNAEVTVIEENDKYDMLGNKIIDVARKIGR